MRVMRTLSVLAIVVGAFFSITGPASAAPAASEWRGWCGGPATTHTQLIGNLRRFGVLDDIGRKFHVRPVDDSVGNWIRRNTGLATMARTATFGNKGCANGAFFEARARTLKPGDKVWVLTAQLKAKFPNGFSLTPRPGWKRKVVCVKAFNNPTCTNPLEGTACIFVWVPPAKKAVPPKKPKPKPPVTKPKPPTVQPGSCNANNSPGAVVCSTFYVIVTCGGVQINITGSTKEEAIAKAEQYVQNNCNVNLPPQPPPVVPPVPPPANQPPQVVIENPPTHVCVNGQVVIRANFSDPETSRDNLQVTWSATGGTISSGRERATFTAQGTAGTATVTITVSDGTNTPVPVTISFPIRAEQWPPTPESC